MKKTLLITTLSILLVGCTNPFIEKNEDLQIPATDGVTRTERIPAVVNRQPANVADFYFEATKDGLILKLVSDKNFEQTLSKNPIESADITDGILTFIEKIGNGTQTQVFNLEPLVEKLNQ